MLAGVATTIADLTSQLATVNTQIRELEEPDVFSCKRMSGYSDESAPVSYTACDVEQPSGLVDLDSGKFTVPKDGVYRLTFTARYINILQCFVRIKQKSHIECLLRMDR